MTNSALDLLVRRELGSWSCQWDRMVDAAAVPSPFMRSWWLTATAGPRPCFLLAVRKDQLLGGLALEESRRLGVSCLRMMGAGPLCPDNLDLLAAPDQEEGVLSLVQTWLGRPGSRLLVFEGVAATSRLVAVLPDGVRPDTMAVAPWTPIPQSSDEYISDRPALFRRNLRRAATRLAATGATHRTQRGSAALERLDVLRKLHHAQWGERSNFLPHFDTFAAGCRLAAEVDELAVHELRADQTVAAILVAFEVGRRVSFYQSARLTDNCWREASTVLLAAAISDACERGFTEVDFLRGDEPYKRNFASQRRDLLRLQVAKGWPAKLAMKADTAGRRARRIVSFTATQSTLLVRRKSRGKRATRQ